MGINKIDQREIIHNEISSPICVSVQVILRDHKTKDSDHQILKWWLWTKAVQ